jgi:hypothetical protein
MSVNGHAVVVVVVIDDSDTDGIVPISPIAAPVFLSLLMGQWGSARRLFFGQVLVAGQRNADVSKNGILIHRRNDRAMDVLREVLSSLSLWDKATNVVVLLYGSGIRAHHAAYVHDMKR